MPWSKQHEAFAKYLSETQWGPSEVTPEERQLLKDSPALHPPPEATPLCFSIKNETILLLDYVGELEILRLVNRCLTEKKVPQEWKDAFVVSIYKGKGHDSDPANYRPIALLSTLYKIYAALLQKRLARAHDQHLRGTQYGFRVQRSTRDPLFILRRLQDYSLKTGRSFQLLFLDWRMAFDKIDHESMLIALERLGVHRHYVDIVSDLYTAQVFHTRGRLGEVKQAIPHTGSRQGCPLSPYLFIMVMTVLFHDVDVRLRAGGVPTNTWPIGKPIYDLEYADDTLLMGVTSEQTNEFLKALQVEATLYGMLLNPVKTEHLPHPQATPQTLHFANGDPIPQAEASKYLGTKVTWDAPTKAAIEDRKAKGHTAYMKLQQLWRSKLHTRAKIKIFQSTIVPSLTYSLDTLTLELKHFKTIDGWYHRYLRRCIGVKASYYSHVSNRRVSACAGRPKLPSQILMEQQIHQFCKILATPPDNPIHHVVFSPGYKDRIKFARAARRGHPQRYWLEQMVEWILPAFQAHIDQTAPEHRRDLLGLKQYLQLHPEFSLQLETAPTRSPNLFKRHAALGCAWQP